MKEIIIGKNKVGLMHMPIFVADIAANHDGDLQRAFDLIELAKESGADVAKFQNFVADKIVSNLGFERMHNKVSHQSKWTKSAYETYEDASISYEWTSKLYQKCKEVGIEYMTSPYDFESVDQANQYVNAYKIGSGDITWIEILKYIASQGKPVLLATGASNIEEVDIAVEAILEKQKDLVLMQCNTNYTGSEDNSFFVNLNVLKTFSTRYPDVILGFSDHTFGHASVLGAIALGARVIEKHFTDDNDREGPDHRFSMKPESWRQMVTESKTLFNALGDGQKKVELNENETVIIQRRGMYSKNNLSVGQKIEESDIIALRPAAPEQYAINELNKVVGKVLVKPIKVGEPILKESVEG